MEISRKQKIVIPSNETIANMAMNSTGTYLAYSTKNKFKILKISTDPPRINKVHVDVKILPKLFKFSSEKLLITDIQGKVQLIDLANESIYQVLHHKNTLSHIDIFYN